MENLLCEATTSTPAIRADADTGVLSISGRSCPEDHQAFFTPVLGWVKRFLSSTQSPFRLEIRQIYFDGNSIRVLSHILYLLEKAHAKGREVSAIWYLDGSSTGEHELARAFAEDCSFPFHRLLEY